MKKKYTAPQTSTTLLTDIPSLCAGSLGNGNTPNANIQEVQQSEGGMSSDARTSYSIWDDEDS